MIHITGTNWPYGCAPAVALTSALFAECERRRDFTWRFEHVDDEQPLIELERRTGPEQCVIRITPAGRWFMPSCITYGDNWKLAGPDSGGQLYMGPDPFWMAHDCGVLLRRFFP